MPPAGEGSARHMYEWALLRLVPRVERGEFVNAGAVVYCRSLDYLAAATHLDEGRAAALGPQLDLALARRHLDAAVALCAGADAAGDNGRRPMGERFRWLTAPRSAVVQPSPVHTGVTHDPAAELQRILATLVR
nr:DUF3037 domain-containing protein [Vallicoccus soli]